MSRLVSCLPCSRVPKQAWRAGNPGLYRERAANQYEQGNMGSRGIASWPWPDRTSISLGSWSSNCLAMRIPRSSINNRIWSISLRQVSSSRMTIADVRNLTYALSLTAGCLTATARDGPSDPNFEATGTRGKFNDPQNKAFPITNPASKSDQKD